MDDITSAISAVRSRLPGLQTLIDEPLSAHTSFRIGGPAAAVCIPAGVSEMAALLKILRELGVRPLILGNGTNILADDAPHERIAVKTTGMSAAALTGACEITAQAGVPLHRLALLACEHGLGGLEFAHGIPGTLGGALYMNAGAYGGEMRGVVERTQILTPGGEITELAGEEHQFSYRHSRLADSGELALRSVIRLGRAQPQEIRGRMEELAARRRQSQPLNFPSAGSTFKRPAGGYAAALIDEAGLKGYAVGGAQVSEKHAGFVINRGGASFRDVLAVMEHVTHVVRDRFGVTLEPEVKIIRAVE